MHFYPDMIEMLHVQQNGEKLQGKQNTNKLNLEHPDINNTDTFIQVLASRVKGKLQSEHSELSCDCIIALHCKHTDQQTRAHKQQRICKYAAVQRSSFLQTNVSANNQL